MNFSGISKIQVSNEALEGYYNRLISNVNSAYDVSVKFDNRPNIVTTFAKVFIKGNTVDFRFYTKAIANQWEDVFITSDGVGSTEEALIFIFTYLVTKVFAFNKDTSFEVKSNMFDTYRSDKDFIDVSEKFSSLFEVYSSFIPKTSSINIDDILGMTIKKPYPGIPEE